MIRALFTVIVFVIISVWIGRALERRLDARRAGTGHPHRGGEVRVRLPDRLRRAARPVRFRAQPRRAQHLRWRARPRPRLRPAGDRRQLRQRLRAADGQVDQARRRDQFHRHDRHQHRGLRLGAGAARPLRGRARPRRRRDAGSEPEPDHQPGHQLELQRQARALKLPVRISYDDDPEVAMQVLLEAAMLAADPGTTRRSRG